MGHRSRIVLDALKSHNRHLTDAERTGKYGKMAQSAFRFYRGTNHLFWADFSGDSRLHHFGSENTRIWLQGDLHIENYGAYGNDDGDVVYSLNDFDDAVVSDYQFDLWRMAVSIVLVARQTTNRSFSCHEIETFVDAFVEAYLDALADYRGNRNEHHLTFTADSLTDHLDEFLESVAKRTTLKQFLNQWTILEKDDSVSKEGYRRFKCQELPSKLMPATSQDWQAIAPQMAQYGKTLQGNIAYDEQHFKIQDIAKRINAGTGSLGAMRYYVLISASSQDHHQGRILDIKHQSQPTPYSYMTEADRHIYQQIFGNNHAHRHAVAYRALTNKTDDYLGWMYLKSLPNHVPAYFSVRELSPYKRSFDITNISTAKVFTAVAANWGLILATAHSRADKNFDSTFIDYSFEKQVECLTHSHHSEVRDLVKSIAFSYADQVETDWQTFLNSDLIGGKINR